MSSDDQCESMLFNKYQCWREEGHTDDHTITGTDSGYEYLMRWHD